MGGDRLPDVLAVGELNPRGANPRLALFPLPRGASGDRLRILMGLADVDYLRCVARTNLCDLSWSGAIARARGRALLWSEGPPVLVLLGARVRDALDGPPFFESRPWRHPSGQGSEKVLLSLPHPSGRCLLWNDPARRERARALLRELVPGVPWGSIEGRSS